MTITNFEKLVDLLYRRGTRKRIAVVNGIDNHTQRAIEMALDEGIADIIFVGGRDVISRNQICPHFTTHVSYVDAADPDDAARRAVELIREGNADILMKGKLNTDNLLRAVLDRDKGMLPKGNVLTQITLADIPTFPRMLLFSDAAVIPFPTQEQRIAQVRYVVHAWHIMGVECPRVSLIHCSEKVDARHFPYTAGYADIKHMAERGDFGKCIVDGPLDLSTSCSPEALAVKGISSPLEGRADALILPDIETGNVLHKSLALFARARTASVLQGALAPVVLPSRGDSIEGKFLSIALAAL